MQPAESLSSDSSKIRLSAIFGIDAFIAKPHNPYGQAAVDLLVAFVREHAVTPTPAPALALTSCTDSQSTHVAPDIQRALTVAIVRRSEHRSLDLSGLYLPGVDLKFVNASRLNFNRTNLSDAHFEGGNLSGSTFQGAVADSACFLGADLKMTTFGKDNAASSAASMRNAQLGDADLSGADLTCVDAQYAILGSAKLNGSTLRGANLQNAYLRSVSLGHAIVSHATLTDADMHDADLDSANLMMTNGLTPDQIKIARVDSRTIMPDRSRSWPMSCSG